jgi:hypothetical protein
MLTDVSEVRTASIIALMMEAVRTPQTSVNINSTTSQNALLHIRRRENMKSHKETGSF